MQGKHVQANGVVAHDADVTVDVHDGRPHVVAPVIAVQEGVLKGALLPADEIEDAADAFNGVPLPVTHPKEDGEYVTANTPERIERYAVGRYFETEIKGSKLAGSLYVDAVKSLAAAESFGDESLAQPLARLMAHVDDGVREELVGVLSDMGLNVDLLATDGDGTAEGDTDGSGAANDAMLEVSTAYWYNPDDESGSFDGNEYETVQRDLRPDHLALLPNGVGECSVEDGCGAPRANDGQSGMAVNCPDCGGSCGGHESNADGAGELGMRLRNLLSFGSPGGTGEPTNTETNDNPTMDDEQLKEMGLSEDAIEALGDDDRAALSDSLTESDDGGADDGGTDPDPDPSTNDDGSALPDAVADELESLSEEVGALKEELNERDERRRDSAREVVEAHTSLDDDVLDSMGTEALEALAEDYGMATGTDMAGQIGMTPPRNGAANAAGGGEADESSKAIIAALNGDGDGGDDE